MNMNDEVICGHLVTAQKKRVNAVYLDLLQEFDRLCRQNGFTYWVTYGSLIGAVRHKGFVPWDDDVDVQMPRKDFDKLRHMTSQAFGAQDPYFLQTPYTDPLFQQRILRFRRSDTACVSPYDLKMATKAGGIYNMGLALAIFPLDNWPKSRLIQKLQLTIARTGVDFRTDGGQVKKKTLLNGAMHLADKVVTEKMIVRIINGMYKLCPKNRSGMVQTFEGFYNGRNVWPAEDYAGAAALQLEDITVPVPIGYKDVLAIRYGDYMQLPPEEERTEPHVDFMSADVCYKDVVEMGPDGKVVLKAQYDPALH